jgi:hypothetical protein
MTEEMGLVQPMGEEGRELDEVSEQDREASRELNAATLEPVGSVETAGEIDEAEAIEAAVINLLVMPSVEGQPANLDKDGEGGETIDPRDEYSGVALREGEVLQDEDWNEDGGSTDVVMDGEAKDDQHGDEMMDFKPIPAEESSEGVLDHSIASLDEQADQLPVSRISKIDEFVAKLDTVEDEVGDFRAPSKHSSPRIKIPDPNEPIIPGDPLEPTSESGERPPFDPDTRPTSPTGDQEWNDVPSSRTGGSPSPQETGAIVEDWSTSGDVDDRPIEEMIDLIASPAGEPIAEDDGSQVVPIIPMHMQQDGGEYLGYVKSVKGGIAKAELATHDLGPEEIKKKHTTVLADEAGSLEGRMDFKPIPVEKLEESLLDRKRPEMPVGGEEEHVDKGSSEVALDRKGDDGPAIDGKGDEISLDRKGDDRPVPHEKGDEVALDRKGDDGPTIDMKFVQDPDDIEDVTLKVGKISGPTLKEEIFPRLEVSGDSFKVEIGDDVIPKLEIDPGDMDNKYVKGEPTGDVGLEPRDKIEIIESSSGYENLEPVLGRAVTDLAFRERLAQDPDSALGEYGLSDEELGLLGQISPSQLEQMVAEVQGRFSENKDLSIQAAQGTLLAELLWGTEMKDKIDSVDTGGATHQDSWKGE